MVVGKIGGSVERAQSRVAGDPGVARYKRGTRPLLVCDANVCISMPLLKPSVP